MPAADTKNISAHHRQQSATAMQPSHETPALPRNTHETADQQESCHAQPLPCTGARFLRQCIDEQAFLDQIGLNYKAVLMTAADVARDMRDLHAQGSLHGSLNTSNVLVQCGGTDGRGCTATMDRTAFCPRPVSVKGVEKDVQDFGTLLYELFTWGRADVDAHGNLDVVMVVGNGDVDTPAEVRRPLLPSLMPLDYQVLVQSCWDDSPPTFSEVLESLDDMMSRCRSRSRLLNRRCCSMPPPAKAAAPLQPALEPRLSDPDSAYPADAPLASIDNAGREGEVQGPLARSGGGQGGGAGRVMPPVRNSPSWTLRSERSQRALQVSPCMGGSAPVTRLRANKLGRRRSLHASLSRPVLTPRQLLPIAESVDEGPMCIFNTETQDGHAVRLDVPQFFRHSDPCVYTSSEACLMSAEHLFVNTERSSSSTRLSKVIGDFKRQLLGTTCRSKR